MPARPGRLAAVPRPSTGDAGRLRRRPARARSRRSASRAARPAPPRRARRRSPPPSSSEVFMILEHDVLVCACPRGAVWAAVRIMRWLWWETTKSPAGRSFGLGVSSLLLGGSQLAALPGSGHPLDWLRLLAGLILVPAGVSQLWAGVLLRRQRRTKLLQAVATAASALERRRRGELGPDQADET